MSLTLRFGKDPPTGHLENYFYKIGGRWVAGWVVPDENNATLWPILIPSGLDKFFLWAYCGNILHITQLNIVFLSRQTSGDLLNLLYKHT